MGIVTISMEVELGWGDHDTRNLQRLSEDGVIERQHLSKLLQTTDEYSIPISFDIVGHLFLEECSGNHDGPHDDEWFQGDPGTDMQSDGLFYAPDIVEEIQNAKTDHELCTHTFSHALFDEISLEVSEWELELVQQLHRQHIGEPTVSLVPPRHQSPSQDVLSDQDIRVFRPAMHRNAKTKIHRFKELLAGPLPQSSLRETDGIVETYCTTNPSLTAASLPSGRGTAHPVFRHIPTRLRKHYHLKKLKRATRDVADQDSHIHLWCHLFDLSNGEQFSVVSEYLAWLDEFRRENDIEIATMEELPNYV